MDLFMKQRSKQAANILIYHTVPHSHTIQSNHSLQMSSLLQKVNNHLHFVVIPPTWTHVQHAVPLT